MENKETRRAILNYIERNSKANLGELAIMLGTDEVTVANEIAAMEKEKIICGYHTIIDWDKAGSDMITALIEVRVTPQRDQGFDKITQDEISVYLCKISDTAATQGITLEVIKKNFKLTE